MLGDVISKVLGPQRDIDVAAIIHSDELLDTVRREDPDLVVVSSEDRELVQQAFSASGLLKVLVVAHEGRTAFLHELRPIATSIRYTRPHDLVEVIREAGAKKAVGDRLPATSS
jgi:hypothetical protein